jgi:hypothetical protein
VEALVAKADAGVVGFVEAAERAFARVVRQIRRDERKATRAVASVERDVARKAVAAERAVAEPARRTARAGEGLLKQIASEVASVAGTVFCTPGRSGRAVEALVAYWALGAWSFLGRIALWAATPVRKRVARRAKRQALDSITMTPDHKAHRELLALLGAGVLLVAGATVVSGEHFGLRQAGGMDLGSLAGLPAQAWDMVLSFSPLKLTVVAALAVLAFAATAFWVRMLRDSYRRDYPTAVEQTQWRLVVTFLFIPGAVLYFFKQYNRLTPRMFASRHVVSLMVTGVTVLVVTSTYGTLWYFNQKAQADVEGAGYNPPAIDLSADERRSILSRDRYGAPLKPATTSRRDPFAPIPGENATPSPTPSPSPTATPES